MTTAWVWSSLGSPIDPGHIQHGSGISRCYDDNIRRRSEPGFYLLKRGFQSMSAYLPHDRKRARWA